MFIALDKLEHQGVRQAIVVVPEKTIGASFNDEPLTKFGFWADWTVQPRWNLCNAPGEDGGKIKSVAAFLTIPRHGEPEYFVAVLGWIDSVFVMIRPNFHSPEDRLELERCVRRHREGHGIARRANALLLLDDGESCVQIAKFLDLDDDTIRGWHKA